MPKTAAPATIRLRVDQFDKRASQLGLRSDMAAARYIGINNGTLGRIRRGEIAPGERFIAACLLRLDRSFEYLFEVAEQLQDGKGQREGTPA